MKNKYKFHVTPVPASRPRVTRYGTYYGKVYTQYLKDFEASVGGLQEPWEGNLYVVAEFVCHTPKKVTRDNPRGDIDNYAKALFDAMTKKNFWIDDDQIVHTTLTKRYALPKEAPHTRVEIYHYDG